jgi:Mg-chelatase subunit ChlD
MNLTKPLIRLRAAAAVALLLASLPAFAARDVMLVLDNSGSMRGNDPARLATPAVMEFVKAQPRDTRVGIILFTADAQVIMPLTPAEVAADGEAEKALKSFNYRGRWTQIAAGVERGLYELRTEGRPDARHVIVLMTDGLIDTGNAAHDAELNKWLRQDLAPQAAREKVGIFGVAFTERADYQLLQSLAAATNAQYFRVLNANGIARALQGIESALNAESAALAAAAPSAAAPAAAPAPVEPAPATAPPAADAAPADSAGEGRSWGWLLWILAFLVLALAGVGAWWRLRHQRQPAEREAPTGRHSYAGVQGVLYDAMERYEIGEKPVVIGRAGGTDSSRTYVIVPEKTVGRWHATIERRGQTFWLRDEGSVNGTFINGERIQGERPLKHRDQVRFHNHQFEFEIPELGEADRTVMQPSTH